MGNRVKYVSAAVLGLMLMAVQAQPSLAVKAGFAVVETAPGNQVEQRESAAIEKEFIFESDSYVNPDIIYTGEKGASRISKSSVSPAAAEIAGDLSELKDAIYNKMSSREENFEINYTGDTSNLKPDIQAVLAEIDMQDEYLANSRGGYSWSATGYVNDATITFNVNYLHSKSQEDYIESETDEILSSIILPGMTDLEKLKAVNDYIVLNTQYGDDTFASAHSPYAILSEGKGVCQAYALLEYKMLGKLGFERRYVAGDAGGVGHAWNSVNLGGSWYFIDSTWNDPTPDRKNKVSYKYFLVTQQYLDDDHNWNQSDYQQTGYDDYSYFHEMSDTSFDSDYIYYSSEGDEDTLHKVSIDGSEDVKLNGDRSYYIAGRGEWIYYSNYSKGGYIYRIKKDGTGEEQFNSVHSTDLYIDGDRLVYTNESTGAKEYIQLEQEPEEDTREELDMDPSYVWDEPFSPKAGQPSDKQWTVEFSKPLDGSAVNGQNVFVGESEGGVLLKTDISVNLTDASHIKIQPADAWNSGGVYYLFIKDGVKSQSGEFLGKGIKMKFTIE